MTEFEEWPGVARRAQKPQELRPAETSENSQKLGFDTYLLAPRKRSKAGPCLCGIGDDFLHNYILINGELTEVPLQWSEGNYTATQIVEGKSSKEMMRSQKLVLVQVEDHSRVWFEVSILNKDLTYPFESELLGMRCWASTGYTIARKKFRDLLRAKRKEVTIAG